MSLPQCRRSSKPNRKLSTKPGRRAVEHGKVDAGEASRAIREKPDMTRTRALPFKCSAVRFILGDGRSSALIERTPAGGRAW